MRAGTLKERVIIQYKTVTPDAAGDVTEVWSNLVLTDGGKIPANILFRNGKEFITAGAEASQTTASIRIRKLSGITSSMRVLHGTDIYNISAVLPGPTNVYIDLAVTSGVNDG